jgi:hypothetical protein
MININFVLFVETIVMALDDIGCRPRQFRHRQALALVEAQDALTLAKENGKPIAKPEQPEELKNAQTRDEIDPYGPIDDFGSPEAIKSAKELGISPRALAGLRLAAVLNVDLDEIVFVQPSDDSDTLVNVAARCSQVGQRFYDRNPWLRRLLEEEEDGEGEGEEEDKEKEGARFRKAATWVAAS